MNKTNKAIHSLTELLQGPMDQYNAARRPDEMDLLAEVRQRMHAVGLKDKMSTAFECNRFIIEAIDRPAHAQQYNLTRYFSLQLMACSHDTSVQRYALIYEIRPDEWLKVFDSVILPAIVNFDLPIVI